MIWLVVVVVCVFFRFVCLFFVSLSWCVFSVIVLDEIIVICCLVFVWLVMLVMSFVI